MIPVGINENIIFDNAEINDKGTLEVTVKRSSGDDDPLAIFNSTATTMYNDGEVRNIFWPFKIDDYVKTAEDVSKRIHNMKMLLNDILLGYFDESEITWDVLSGTGITAENKDKKLTQDTTLQIIYKNIAEQFIAMMKKADKSKQFRVKFVRTSVTKHYAKFPAYPPYWESMDVAAEDSRLAFTTYEKNKNLDNGDPVAIDSEPTPGAAEEIDEVFGMTDPNRDI